MVYTTAPDKTFDHIRNIRSLTQEKELGKGDTSLIIMPAPNQPQEVSQVCWPCYKDKLRCDAYIPALDAGQPCASCIMRGRKLCPRFLCQVCREVPVRFQHWPCGDDHKSCTTQTMRTCERCGDAVAKDSPHCPRCRAYAAVALMRLSQNPVIPR